MADSGHTPVSGSSVSRRLCSVPEKFQLHLAMLALQFGYAGFHVVSRLALNMGISKIVFPVYRNILALLLLLPFAYFLEKKERPPISWNLLLQFFLLAIVGITANQGFYLLGLDNTSPTFASAIQNSVPAITFLLAAILRIEKVRLDRKDGISKIAGTLLCVTGASVITLFQGPTIYNPKPHLTLGGAQAKVAAELVGDSSKNWTLGCLFLIGHCLSWSGWLVLQAPVLKKFPARLTFTSYQCFFGILQFLVIAVAVERDSKAWLVHSGEELFSVFYAVISDLLIFIGCGGIRDRFCRTNMVYRSRGPVFVAVYQPVQTLVVALMASILLGEEFYLGGIIGAVLIIAGLYFVLWGKNEERKFAVAEGGGASTVKQPLLSQSTTEIA